MGRSIVNPKMLLMRFSTSDKTMGVRGVQTSSFFGRYSNQSLPSDAVGTVTLSLSGIKPGSEVKIFNADAALIGDTESVSGVPSFVLSRFAPGSRLNTVRILIINLAYEVVDLTIELGTTNTTVPVFQRIDRNYRNPA